VPFFFKQWGEWAPNYGLNNGLGHTFDAKTWAHKIGKKRAGRLLDGIEHNGMPA
jgi:hypothetical protein